MTPLVRRLAVVGLILLAAAGGGIALGDFVLSAPPTRAAADNALAESEPGALPQDTARSAADLSPDHYVCKGCDSRPPGEPAVEDGFEPFDSAPLPPYRPATPPQASLDEEIPAIAADRTAPDALRRRAAVPGAALPPVLAADRRAAPPAGDNAAEPVR